MILTVHVIASSAISSVLPPGVSHGASLASHYKLDAFKHWEADKFFKSSFSQHVFVIFDILASFFVYYLILSYFHYSAWSLTLFSSSLMGIMPDLTKYFGLHKRFKIFKRLEQYHEKIHNRWREEEWQKIKEKIDLKIEKYKNKYSQYKNRYEGDVILWKKRLDEAFAKNLPVWQFSLAFGMIILLIKI